MNLERRTPMPRGKELKRGTGMPPRSPENALKRGTGLSRARRTESTPKAARDTGAPQAVRDAVFDRDRWCLRCGEAPVKGQGGYSIHHLTLRSHGVDNSVEAQILLCGSGTTGCHGHVHANPAEARAAGWIRRGNTNAGTASQPVMVALPSGYGWFVLLPDGTRRGVEAPEETVAA